MELVDKIGERLQSPDLDVFRQTYETPVIDPMFMDPETGLAWFDRKAKTLRLLIGTQSPGYDVNSARALFAPKGCPIEIDDVHLYAAYPGGGFGGRDTSILCLYLALADGMGGSIAFGVSKLAANLDGAIIVPGDMPFLTPGVIESLGARFRERDGKSVVFPATPAGEQRNPVIWPRRFFGLLEGLTGPQGGKRLLIELAGSCSAVLMTDETVLLDIDAADDLPAA
jgi:hypothetical protein